MIVAYVVMTTIAFNASYLVGCDHAADSVACAPQYVPHYFVPTAYEWTETKQIKLVTTNNTREIIYRTFMETVGPSKDTITRFELWNEPDIEAFK